MNLKNSTNGVYVTDLQLILRKPTLCFSLLKKTSDIINLKMNNEIISKTAGIRFLGVDYDDSLSFKYHIHNLTLKISRHIALLYQIKDFMPLNVLKSIYYTHIYSLITYCNPIWCTTYTIYLTTLKIVTQKNCKNYY